MKNKLHITSSVLLAGAASLHAGTVLDVDYNHLTPGSTIGDGSRIQDSSGNDYHGFWGDAAGSYPVIAIPGGGVGLDTTATTRGHTFHRDGLAVSELGWIPPFDGTTPSPYFNLDGGTAGTGTFTLEAVVNWNGTSSGVNGLMGQTGGSQAWLRENGGSIQYAFGAEGVLDANNFGTNIDVSAAKADGLWHGIAVVYDGPAGEIRTYLDDVLIHTNTDTDIGNLGSLLNGTSDFRTGAYNTSDPAAFNGLQDRYRISDAALAPIDFLPVPVIVVIPGRDITWTGATDGTWDIMTTNNWELDSDSSVTHYEETDNLIFDDNGANTAITISAGGGTVSPDSILFNSSLAYSLAGDGTAGSALLTKQGTGSLTLTNPNGYTGGTDLQGGAIVAGDGALAGEIGAGAVSTTAGTTLTISRSDILDYSDGSKLRELSGDGGLIIDGGVNLIVNPGSGSDFDFDLLNGWAAFTGPVTIKGDSILDTRKMGRTALGSGTVTLGDGSSNGSLATHVGNWTWTSDIDLVGSANQILNNNTSGTNRALKLQGILSGAGGLNFSDLNGTMLDPDRGFILTGTNTLSGAITIDFGTPVRVGGIPGDDITPDPDAFGTLGTATIANEGSLTFARTDAHQVDNTITGNGEVRIGLTVGGTETQVVTIGTSQTYTGATIIADGTLLVPSGVTLDSPIIDVQGAGTLSGNGTLNGDIDVTGNLAPGASVGTLTTPGILGLLGSSTYTWEITTWGGTTPGTDHDFISADVIDIVATNVDPVTIAVTPDSLTGFAETNQTYTVATATTAIDNFAVDAFTVDASALVGAFGTWAVQLSVDTLSLELVYTAGSGSPYDVWAAGFGLENPWLGVDPALNGEPTADPDGDGVSNEDEFAFGLDPTNSSSVNPIVQDLDQATGTFRYTRHSTSTLIYTIETSTSLASWTPDATATAGQSVISTDGNGVETVEVTVTGAPLTDPAFFVRVDAQ